MVDVPALSSLNPKLIFIPKTGLLNVGFIDDQLCHLLQVSLVSCPRARLLCRIETLHPPGHAVIAAVLGAQ